MREYRNQKPTEAGPSKAARGAPRLEDSGFCFLPHWESGSWGARVWPGRSPAGQASLPREQEARPRPADLLLEVRGLGRPSRPHFLQPRPTPCGPRIYGNCSLDRFSEIIRSLPSLNPARAGRDPGWLRVQGDAAQGRWEAKLGGDSGPAPPPAFSISICFTISGSRFGDSPWRMACGAIVGRKARLTQEVLCPRLSLGSSDVQYAFLVERVPPHPSPSDPEISALPQNNMGR